MPACEAAAIEKGLFVWRRLAAEHRIAVRKTAEPLDDVAVLDRVLHISSARSAVCSTQKCWSARSSECSKGRRKNTRRFCSTACQMAGLKRLPGEVPRQRIGREHVRRAAKAVARELVEQDHQRQRAFGMVDPVVELAPRRRKMQLAEPVVEAGVECGVLREPGILSGIAPEFDDFRRARIQFGHVTLPRLRLRLCLRAHRRRLRSSPGRGALAASAASAPARVCCPSSGDGRPAGRRRSAIPAARRRGAGHPR